MPEYSSIEVQALRAGPVFFMTEVGGVSVTEQCKGLMKVESTKKITI